MTKLSDLGTPITGKRHEGEPAAKRDYFYACPICGQPVDRRDLRQVIWHEQHGREALEIDA
ncbi:MULTISPECIES: hypothetical protein [unclassified Mesorhizobium]|uniref:hypothetical protein n=1 Tax=unclassified Mesorhizobium TaxID=325217 RepID=UPI00109344E0|nr:MULTISPECIES: hypothetical protein [unclassified Mesorhizobium]TGP66949.1 hypothetical protein EN867_33335 [Mesorhizobium sp. M2D.F.Ca.ET.224.01.1.1]TGS69007.1 hypothetical protein EN844_09000 [Mesorhizobium sp. M3A.F.Ca.ET.201.01.1.1]